MPQADGTVTWCALALTRLPTGGTGPDVLVQLVDVTARREVELALAAQAQHDPLTGLANRTALAERLSGLLAPSGPGALLVLLDLDGFKAVNDTHGHAAGDAVLVAVAARLGAVVRADDLVVRLGGDEFVVACPCPLDSAVARTVELTARLHAAVVVPVVHDGHTLGVGASTGSAYGPPGSDPAVLLEAADRAMYRVKQARHGRAAMSGARVPAQRTP